jgi:hypothetical protein
MLSTKRKHIVGTMVDLEKQPMLGVFQSLDSTIISAIDLRTEVIDDAATAVMNRAEVKLVPERRSILAVVQSFNTGLALLLYRRPNFGNGDFGCRCALQETTVSAKNLLRTVSVNFRKASFASTMG